MRVVTSTSARARVDCAREFLSRYLPSTEVLVVGASRGAADDLARDVARHAGATFGIWRSGFTELAARAASMDVDRAPGSQAGSEAVAARATFDALTGSELRYFAPVASMPGFPRALARTLHELRLAGVNADRLDDHGPAASDVGRLLARVERQLADAHVDDRAGLFRLAAKACRSGAFTPAASPIVLLDVPLDSRAEQEFVSALASRSRDMLVTMADGDLVSMAGLLAMGGDIETLPDSAASSSDLYHLRRHVFRVERPGPREPAGDVRLFSAPGEGRETVEILRRVLDEASRGVPFDEMAVFLRTPQQYLGLLEHTCVRAGVPAFFDRGTRRPDPAGRSFVALLSCAVENLSARRFDEYLSLGQVPQMADRRPIPAVVRPLDEALDNPDAVDGGEHPDDPVPPAAADSDEEAIVAGTLRSPWKWEELIVESSVVGGRNRFDGKARWRRRLAGLEADYQYRIEEERRDDPDSPRLAGFERDLRNLQHLRAFALPIVDELAAWPNEATWGEWLGRFEALASRALRRPARVMRTLADLRPMATVGPVTLEQARDALHDRLVTLDWDPPARRYGRLFVGTPHQARGRSFRVVFVPGLAERVVPQRPREDPLLLDDRRAEIDAALVRQDTRGSAERLLLKIAVGAAVERLYVSFPRLDVAETRARVPSFYALDIVRAITGRVPDYRVLSADASDEGGASLAWPAPKDPDRAIDDLEHDLAVLKPLLESRDPAAVKGRAHYLLGLNDALKRSVISQWSRWRKPWSTSDGLVRVSPATRRMLERQRLDKREYSLSALQRFATCPYQFLLATVHRLQKWEEPEPLVRMDPLTRGSLFHRAQAEFFRAMSAAGRLPIATTDVGAAAATLDEVLERVAKEYEEQLAPAIDRVWRDEIDELRRDLGIWVRRVAEAADWIPEYFEFSFGLSDEGRDPRSLPDAVVIDNGFRLRGSVDLIERHRDRDVLRVTDHKTGKARTTADLIVGGGKVLQPVLYSVAVEKALGKRVLEGRLFFATTVGGFASQPIEINDYTRGQGIQALTIVDRSVELGFLAAAPDKGACAWCDFRPVCGPREEARIKEKAADRLADLEALRSMR